MGACNLTIIFSTGRDLISATIRKLTKAPVSHVAFGLEFCGVAVVLHATIGGVQVTPYAKFTRTSRIVAKFEPLVAIDIAAAVKHLGDRYDYVGLLGYIPVLAARWLGRKIKNPWASPRSTVCSELVIRSGAQTVPEWHTLDPERTTPGELLAVCRVGTSWKERKP